jgi:ribosomal-protein-serine acetyltransferase
MKPINFPSYIKSDRIYLRSLKPEDANVLFDLIDSQRKYIGEHLDWIENIQTLDDEIKYVQKRIEAKKDLKEFNWCIFKNDTDEFLGYIGTDPVSTELLKKGECIDWVSGTISFAYFLKQEANGNGYMAEALCALKDLAVELGFKRIEINSEAANIKSQKVAQRCGFTHDKRDTGKMYFETK